jgi:hypothetical protein
VVAQSSAPSGTERGKAERRCGLHYEVLIQAFPNVAAPGRVAPSHVCASSHRRASVPMAEELSMVKRALIIAAGCALFAGPVPALAQSLPPGPDRDGDRMVRQDMRGDRDWRGGWRRDDGDRDDRRAYRDDGQRGSEENRNWGGGRDDSPRRGAHFWLRSGDTRLGVRCDPNEPMRACVDAATTLLDKARSLATVGASSTPPASSGAGSPPR